MSANASVTTYVVQAGVRWARDMDRIIIVDERSRLSCVLDGVDAAIWDWLAANHPLARVIALTAALLSIPEKQSEEIIRTALGNWHAQGLLKVE